MNNRRKLIVVLGASSLVRPLSTFAQQPTARINRIGYLDLNFNAGTYSTFLKGLAELGYVDGKNIIIERRSGEGKEERLPVLAIDLVRLKVDVIIALSPPAAHAAQYATKTIPIVIRSTDDPVMMGFVSSLAHPGGNITGMTAISSELYGKRLELLKEFIPRLSRVAVLHNPDRSASDFKEMQSAARSLGLQLQSVEVRGPNDFENAFRAAGKVRAQALITIRTPLINDQRKQVAGLAIKSRLPAIYDEAAYVEAGGLMSYGASLTEIYRHLGRYVDKILKGAKPGDIPVEQPNRFELVINMKTAKVLSIKFPNSILLRVDKVIE